MARRGRRANPDRIGVNAADPSPAPVAAAAHPAPGDILALVYARLRDRAAALLQHEPDGHTLQATALVHEALLRLLGGSPAVVADEGHLLALAAIAMRRVLVDHARASRAMKRGGAAPTLSLATAAPLSDDGVRDTLDILALDEALSRLASLNARHARTVELRYFAGLTIDQAAQTLGISPKTVEKDWRLARAFLRRELSRGSP